MRAEQAGTSVNLAVRVGNGGAIASPPTVAVTFYDGDPANGGIVIGTVSTTRTLYPGDFQDVVYSWSGGNLGLHHIYAVADAANAISECRKDDNQAEVNYTIVVEYPDLKISAEDITLPAGPYYEGSPVPITVNVKNIGGLSASNVAVRLYNGNPASGEMQIGSDQIIPVINQIPELLYRLYLVTIHSENQGPMFFTLLPIPTICSWKSARPITPPRSASGYSHRCFRISRSRWMISSSRLYLLQKGTSLV